MFLWFCDVAFSQLFFSCSGECEHRQQGGSIGGGPRIRDRLSKHRIKASGTHHLVFGRPKTRGRWNGIGEYRTKTCTMGPNPNWKSQIYWLITGNQILGSQPLRIPTANFHKKAFQHYSIVIITLLMNFRFLFKIGLKRSKNYVTKIIEYARRALILFWANQKTCQLVFGILKRRLLRFSYLCITWLISSHFWK